MFRGMLGSVPEQQAVPHIQPGAYARHELHVPLQGARRLLRRF